jgi:hypothetical protein
MTLAQLRTAINTAFTATTALKTLHTDYLEFVNTLHNSTTPILFITPPEPNYKLRGKESDRKTYKLQIRVMSPREQKEGANLWTLWGTLESYAILFIKALLTNADIYEATLTNEVNPRYYIDESANDYASVLIEIDLVVKSC